MIDLSTGDWKQCQLLLLRLVRLAMAMYKARWIDSMIHIGISDVFAWLIHWVFSFLFIVLL